MATRDELQAASDKMDAAEQALLDYALRSPDVDANPALHRKLNEDLRNATEEFLALIAIE